jgi:hypothetical protein
MGIHKNVNSSHDKIIFYMAFYLGISHRIVIDNVPDDCSLRALRFVFLFKVEDAFYILEISLRLWGATRDVLHQNAIVGS